MKANPNKRAQPKIKTARRVAAPTRYILILFIAGHSPKSVNAIANIKKICEEHLQGRYQLDVIDLYQQPQHALGEQIIALPTLLRKFPSPVRRIIGDLSNTERVLVGLDLRRSE